MLTLPLKTESREREKGSERKKGKEIVSRERPRIIWEKIGKRQDERESTVHRHVLYMYTKTSCMYVCYIER